MSRNSKARSARHGLVAMLSVAIASAVATGNAGANSTKENRVQAEQQPRAEQKFTVASLATSNRPTRAIHPKSAPAQFFTISGVMAKRENPAGASAATMLASIDPNQTANDAASITIPMPNTDREPFGLSLFAAPEGILWNKWRGVEADIDAEKPALARCRANAKSCSPAAARFKAIIDAASKLSGQARIDAVNQRVNAALRYMSDSKQWGVADRWSGPLDAKGEGSFNTGFGDCEDYAIAKYVALREAGVAASDLRVLLVHDKVAHMDHAVLAARHDGDWLMLDNRHNILLTNKDTWFFSPLFALDQQGVKLFAAPYATRQVPAKEISVAPAAPTLPYIASETLASGGLGTLPLML